jgi:hypothetical protein
MKSLALFLLSPFLPRTSCTSKIRTTSSHLHPPPSSCLLSCIHHILPTFIQDTSSPLDLSAVLCTLCTVQPLITIRLSVLHEDTSIYRAQQTNILTIQLPGTIRLSLLELVRYTEPLLSSIDTFICLSAEIIPDIAKWQPQYQPP